MSRYINKFGLEIEGGWSVIPDIPHFHTDPDPSLEGGARHLTEFISEPIKYNSDHSEPIWEQVERLYEYNSEMNSSMGLHIHVSLNKDGYYPFFTTKKFTEYFREYVSDNLYKFQGKNKERLRRRLSTSSASHGDPHYFCKAYRHYSDLDKNLRGRGRFRKVNFSNLRRSRNTLEFRVFPAMTKASAVKKAYRITTGAINSYLQYERPAAEIVETHRTEETEVERLEPIQKIIG